MNTVLRKVNNTHQAWGPVNRRLRTASILFTPTLLMVIIVLFAFFVRVYNLDGQSMWSDEGLSLYRAQLPLSEVVKNTIIVDGVETRDNSPALYFLLLNIWRRVTGESVFALRYLGVLMSVLGIPLFYLLGRLVGNRRVGLMAAFLLALSPFAVWMSQELRNYGVLLTLNLASIYGLFCFLLGNGNRRWLILWAGAGLLGVYTHYFGYFVLAFGVVVLFGAGLWRQRRPSFLLLVAAIIPLLVLLPVTLVALERFLSGRQIDFYFLSPLTVIWHALSAYTVGINFSLNQPPLRVWPIVLVAFAGIGLLLKRKQNLSVTLIVGYLIVPLAILLAVSQINPLYNGPRHVFIGLPPFLLLVAYGLVKWNGWWRMIGILGVLLLIISQGQWLWMQYHSNSLKKDDLRGAAMYLNHYAEPDDVIILHDTLIRFTFDHYYNGEAPVLAVPPFWQFDEAQAIADLSRAGAAGERIWFFTQPTPRTGFPRESLREWADQNWLKFAELDFLDIWLGVKINAYVADEQVEAVPLAAKPLNVNFNETILLHGVIMSKQMVAGETQWPVFYLARLNPTAGNYTFLVKLVDEEGQTWAQIENQTWLEGAPSSGLDGAIMRYPHEMALPAGVPPGEYTVLLRVLDPDLQPLPAASGGVDVDLGQIQVLAGQDTGQLPEFTAQRERFGPVTLLGYTLPDSAARPGHALPVTLYWQVQRTPAVDYQLRARLLDPAGTVLAESIATPTRADYPVTQWQPGDLLQGQAALLIPGRATDQPYQVEIALLDPVNGEPAGNPVVLEQPVQIDPWPLETTFPPIADPLNATFGRPPLIELAGYEFARDAGQVGLTLFWRSIADDIPDNYRVFVHLVDGDENIVAQTDGFPVQGTRPPAGWRNGEAIVDTHLLFLPELPAGNYALYVGLYNPDSAVRLPVVAAGEQEPDDRLFLQTVEHE